MKNQTPLSDGLSVSTFLVSKKTTPDKLVISREDQETLRCLAGRVAQLAARPIEDEKRDLWFRHNALEATRPLIFCDPENGWNEIITENQIQCQGELAREWEMYVELVTRISVAKLGCDDGLLREALTSLYSLFDTTRGILRHYGPSIAQPKKEGKLSFGYLAVAVLNSALRPVLAKWYPLLLDHENTRDHQVSTREHERKWDKHDELRNILNNVRLVIIEYANILAQVADVPSLIIEGTEDTE